MKRLFAILTLLAVILTGCANNGKGIAHFERSESFEVLLDAVNAEHEAEKIFAGEYESYIVKPVEGVKNFNANDHHHAASQYFKDDKALTPFEVNRDIETLYQLLRTRYGCYEYFGGDAAFRAAIDAVIEDCGKGMRTTCGELVESIEKHFSFVKDAHFTINGHQMGKYEVPFFYRTVDYIKTESGYETLDGKIVASVDGFVDMPVALDDLFKRSLTKKGEIVYYPIWLDSFSYEELTSGSVRCVVPELTVRYTDGTSDTLKADSYTFGNYSKASESVKIQEKNGIPSVTVNQFYYQNGGMQFVHSAANYRDRDILIVDLRECRGGTISMVSNWFTGYTQKEVWGNSTYLDLGKLDPLYRNHASRPEEEFVPLDNVLIVLTSKLTASASEGFVDMGYNLENTLFVGENTHGYRTGNLDYWTLPASGMSVTFGQLLRLYPNSDYFQEYRGFYPDIWCPADEAKEAVMNFIAKNTTVTYEEAEK